MKDNQLKVSHKFYIILAMAMLTLEYLDVLVYIYNCRSLSMQSIENPILNSFSFILIIFVILWLTNFIGKMSGKHLLLRFKSIKIAAIIACGLITLSFFAQAYLWHRYIADEFIILAGLFILRLIYQLALGIITDIIYELLLSIREAGNKFIGLILNSLELSLLIGIIDCKILDFTHITEIDLFSGTLSVIAILWFTIGVIFSYKYTPIVNNWQLLLKTEPIRGIKLSFKQHPYDTLIAFFLIGVRSSLSIIGLVFMPYYLALSLKMSVQNIAVGIGFSSAFALIISFSLKTKLYSYNLVNLIRTSLVALIIGSLISYALFFFKVIPLLAIMILIIFHSLFALICPMILSQLFNDNDRPTAIVACYGSSFFSFSSLTFISLIFFTDIVHSYYISPAIFLISITIICYICMVLFRSKS